MAIFLNSQNFSPAKEKGYQKIVDDILENIKSLQLSPSVLEELVQRHYIENKKIISFISSGEKSKEQIDMVFNKKRSDDRKNWLSKYNLQIWPPLVANFLAPLVGVLV